jgi:hypothetical protein
MFPYIVDPGRYEAYWLNQRELSRRRKMVQLARFAVRFALAAAALVALSRLGPHSV